MNPHALKTLACLLAAALLASCSPKDPRAELDAAQRLMAQGQFAEALPHTALCLAIETDSVDAIVANAICAYAATNATEADRKNARLNLQRASATLAPERFDVWYTLTWLLIQERDFDGAISAARNARGLYRALQTPAIPHNATCDQHDLTLAKANPAYANLLVMYADICRHNRLEEGIQLFVTALQLKSLQLLPEISLAFAQLLIDTDYYRQAAQILRNICRTFPDNVAAAYNLAYFDDQINLLKPPRQTRRDHYQHAIDLATRLGDSRIATRAAERLAKLH